MNKKAKYWAITIVIAVIIIIVIGITAMRNTPKSGDANHADMDHGGMNHNSSQSVSNSDNSNLNSYILEQENIMAEMMKKMEDIEISGNASIDFLNGMIPHHKSAVDMAESYLKYGGGDDRLYKLANNIIEAQTNEIEQMKSMIQILQKSGKTDETKENAYLEEYNKMFSAHHINHGAAQPPSSVEAAFSEGMIEHHQMAIDMAKAILNYSDDADVKEMAQSMIDVQESEISQMQDILNNLDTN